MKLSAKELMIGDWVMYNPNVFIEDEYESTKEWFPTQINSGEDIDLAIEGCYDSIPLTTEILEKNGFEQYGKDAYCFSIPIQMAGDGFEQQNITIHRMKVLELRTSTCTLLMPIKFVHQLQHALKLCGIEKEIVV